MHPNRPKMLLAFLTFLSTENTSFTQAFVKIGISSTLKYKGIDFNIVVSYGMGGVVLDQSYQRLMHGGEWGDNWHTDILDRWTPTNTDTDVPIINGDQNANSYDSLGDGYAHKEMYEDATASDNSRPAGEDLGCTPDGH